MANGHYGEIGDVWKHLPLAEMLAIEQPAYYAESHAGSARYKLAHSVDRDYGVYYFLDRAAGSSVLKRSAYLEILKEHAQRTPPTYPGSPLIAMTLPKKSARKFLFCDTDLESLKDIHSAAAELGLPDKAVDTVQADGVSALERFFSQVSSFNAGDMFAFLDPYQPLEKSANGMTAADLFYYLTWRGVKTVLWYGYDTFDQQQALFDAVKKLFIAGDYDLSDCRLWCGDIHLMGMENPAFDVHPGVMGCGIIAGNLTEKSLTACDRLGQELAGIYEAAMFPNGQSGALRYAAPTISPAPQSAGTETPDDWQ